MAQLKRWESPRRQGRNDKGRGGAARQRQKHKQTQMLKQKLKQSNGAEGKGTINLFPFVFRVFLTAGERKAQN